MFTPQFVQALHNSSASRHKLAKASGLDPFTLCRISAFLQSVQKRDRRALKLAQALGLRPEQAYILPNDPDPAEQISRVSERIGGRS